MEIKTFTPSLERPSFEQHPLYNILSTTTRAVVSQFDEKYSLFYLPWVTPSLQQILMACPKGCRCRDLMPIRFPINLRFFLLKYTVECLYKTNSRTYTFLVDVIYQNT